MKIMTWAEFKTHQDLDLLIMEENLEKSFVSEHFEIYQFKKIAIAQYFSQEKLKTCFKYSNSNR